MRAQFLGAPYSLANTGTFSSWDLIPCSNKATCTSGLLQAEGLGVCEGGSARQGIGLSSEGGRESRGHLPASRTAWNQFSPGPST